MTDSWHGTRPYTSDTKVHIVWLWDKMVGTFATYERAQEEIEWITRQVNEKASLTTLVTDWDTVEDIIETYTPQCTQIQTVPVKK